MVITPPSEQVIPLAQLKQRPNGFVVTHRGEDIFYQNLTSTTFSVRTKKIKITYNLPTSWQKTMGDNRLTGTCTTDEILSAFNCIFFFFFENASKLW